MGCALAAAWREARDGPAGDDAVAWWLARLPRGHGIVLDVGCGYGKLLVPLAAAGIAVHGVDDDAAAIASCEAKLAARNLGGTIYRQSPATLNLPARFAAAIVGPEKLSRAGSRDEVAAMLARVRAHLVGPARLVVEAAIPDWAHARYGAPLVELQEAALADGSRLRARFEIDADPDRGEARIAARYAHRRGSALVAEEADATRVAWFEPEALAAMVRSAGWADATIEEPPPGPSDRGRRYAVVASG